MHLNTYVTPKFAFPHIAALLNRILPRQIHFFGNHRSFTLKNSSKIKESPPQSILSQTYFDTHKKGTDSERSAAN